SMYRFRRVYRHEVMCLPLFLSVSQTPPRSTLFPYTTLFRSETKKASTDIPLRGRVDCSNDTATPPPSAGVPCQRSRQTRSPWVTAGRRRHGLWAKYVDGCLGRRASGETTPLRRAQL